MIKNVIRVLCSNIGTTMIGIVSSLLFPKIMDVNEYALYQTYVLYLSYITILHLGLPTGMFIKYGGKEFNEIDKRKLSAELRLLLVILSCFSVIILAGGIISNRILLVLVGVSILPYDYVRSYLTLLQAWGDFRSYSILNFSILALICIGAAMVYFVTGNLSGMAYIYVYLLIYIILFLWMLIDLIKLAHGIDNKEKILTKEHLTTIKIGLTICIGSYVGSLFHSVDKQFIKFFFEDTQFAMYSFAMSMQTIMTVLISSLSQPMYFKLAASGMIIGDYQMLKELLLLFGTLSSCAYYVCSLMVKLLIPKYIESINIISLFFTVFPAMSVINCLYINLYKSRKMTQKYIRSLVLMLLIAIVLDAIVIIVGFSYFYLAVATVIAYYIWLVLGSIDFPELKLTLRDIRFIIVFFASYFLIVRLNPMNDIMGLFGGLISCCIIGMAFYKKSIFTAFGRIKALRQTDE